MGDGRPGSKKRQKAKQSLRELWRWNVRLWLGLTGLTLAITLLAGFLGKEALAGFLFGCLLSAIYAAVLLFPLWLQSAGDDRRPPSPREPKAKQRAPKKK